MIFDDICKDNFEKFKKYEIHYHIIRGHFQVSVFSNIGSDDACKDNFEILRNIKSNIIIFWLIFLISFWRKIENSTIWWKKMEQTSIIVTKASLFE